MGAAPFVARLEQLAAQREQAADNAEARQPGPGTVFFYCTSDGAPMNGILQALCKRAGIALHLIDKERDGALELTQVLAQSAQPQDSSLWFCGPGPLGDSLEKAWKRSGRAERHFHREFFVMR